MGPLLAGLQRWPVDVVVSIISRSADGVCGDCTNMCTERTHPRRPQNKAQWQGSGWGVACAAFIVRLRFWGATTGQLPRR